MAKGENLRTANFLKKGLEILLLFTVAFAPLVFSRHAADPFWVVEFFFYKTAVSMLAAVWLIKASVEGRFTLFLTPWNIPIAGFLLLGSFGALFASNKPAFLNTMYLNLCNAALFFLVLDYVSDSEKNRGRLILAVLIPGVLMALYGIMQSFGADIIPWQTNFSRRAASTLGNPNFLAGHMVLLIPIAYSMLIKTGRGRGLGKILAAVLLTAALFLSQTRGAYLAYIVSCAALLAMLWKYKPAGAAGAIRPLVIFTCVMACLAAGYVALNVNARERVTGLLAMKDKEAGIRLKLWENTLYMIRDNFLTGSGAGNFHVVYSYYQSKSLKPSDYAVSDYYKTGHAHNDFLHFTAEYGALAAGFMFLFIYTLFSAGIRALKRGAGDGIFIAAFLASATAVLVHGLFNFPFLIVPTTAVFYALAASSAMEQDDYEYSVAEAPVPLRLASVFAAVLLFGAVCVFTLNLLSSAYLRKAREADYFNRPQQAMEYSAVAVELNRWNEENLFFRGLIFEKAGDNENAYDYYIKVYDLNPGHWEANTGLFGYYAEKGMKKEALSTALNMQKISPYSLKAVTAAGYAYYINGLYEPAEKIYLEGLKNRPGNYDILYHLSAVYGAIGDAARAAEFAEQAIAAGGDNAGAYYNLAVAYYRTGDKKKAIQTIERLLKEHPEDQKAIELKEAMRK